MKTKIAIATTIAFASLIGCGGAGDTGRLPSLYQGAWGGNWASGAAREAGAISLTVTSDGSVSGTISRTTGSGNISGFIEKNGRLSAVASFAAGGNMVIGGAVQLSSGRLIGAFNYVQTGIEYAGTFDCGPAAGGSTTGGGTGGSTGGA